MTIDAPACQRKSSTLQCSTQTWVTLSRPCARQDRASQKGGHPCPASSLLQSVRSFNAINGVRRPSGWEPDSGLSSARDLAQDLLQVEEALPAGPRRAEGPPRPLSPAPPPDAPRRDGPPPPDSRPPAADPPGAATVALTPPGPRAPPRPERPRPRSSCGRRGSPGVGGRGPSAIAAASSSCGRGGRTPFQALRAFREYAHLREFKCYPC